MDVKAQAEQLREALNGHNYNYYVLDAPTISDFEYDKMLRELEDLEALISAVRDGRRVLWGRT